MLHDLLQHVTNVDVEVSYHLVASFFTKKSVNVVFIRKRINNTVSPLYMPCTCAIHFEDIPVHKMLL